MCDVPIAYAAFLSRVVLWPVTILSGLLLLFLVVNECVDHWRVKIREEMVIDQRLGDKMSIHLNITFPSLPCQCTWAPPLGLWVCGLCVSGPCADSLVWLRARCVSQQRRTWTSWTSRAIKPWTTTNTLPSRG